jgi:2-keto-4-pentenoate hydratase/2-oxohepta-3-ene-1,7-dioic acid hydratase in catechol pathway
VKLSRPTKIVCVGRNYAAHARELGNDVPSEPLIFLKPPSSMIASGDAIVLPPESQRVEYESEIGIVIGRQTRKVGRADALACVHGFCCANDVTARDLQQTDSQWTRAKGFDTFCAVGPVATDVEWNALEVVGRLNGVEKQRGSTRDMIFDLPQMIEYISHVMTLEPGDLILTGTPAGTSPLHPGDVFEVEIAGIGVLRNPVQAAEA